MIVVCPLGDKFVVRVPVLCVPRLCLSRVARLVMAPYDSLLVRLLTSIGDVYYLLLVPLLCLYLAIFVSNKLHSHQQQRQQQIPRPHITHRRSSAEVAEDAAAATSPLFVDTSSPSSASASLLSGGTASASAPSSPTTPSSSSLLSLTFLLPDQSLVSHSFPVTAPVSTVIATLYPPPSSLATSARLIYQGRLLHSTSSLCQHNMSADDMVHVHLLHASQSAEGGVGAVSGVGSAVSEPPALLVAVLAVMCAALGCGWGVFAVCGDVLFDVPSLCVLLCATGVTVIGVLYAHACTVGQRPAVVPV